MALNFGPQWLRDLSDAGSGAPGSPTTPTGSVKFKLADYRYGREEMLSLFTESSPPPDQVRKHLTIFSKEIQKPITMMPLTEDEQRLTSQGYNSTHVLRAAGRASGPPPRITRGGGSMDRGRGRGRGRGEGYIPRTMENGDVGYSRSAQDGWEQVGRKFERSFSGGAYEEGSAPVKREFPRSSRDNWRDKRPEEGGEEEEATHGSGGAPQAGWRGPRWNAGSAGSSRNNWRDAREAGYDGDRRHPSQGGRGFDHDTRRPRRVSESADNDEVPEWVEDDIEDDPGTFDSKGVFVSTKESRNKESKYEPPHQKQINKKSDASHLGSDDVNKKPDRGAPSNSNKQTYVPPHKQQNGLSTVKERERSSDHTQSPTHDPKEEDSIDSQTGKPRNTENHRGRPDSIDIRKSPNQQNFSQKGGDGDSGFAFPTKVSDGTKAPPGQYFPQEPERGEGEMLAASQPQRNDTVLPNPDTFSLADKTLQNLVAEMTADTERKIENEDVSRALSLNHENAHKWFYRDPQGEVQGPFSNDDMASWFSAGYFTMSLIVKRGCDDSFKQLGELIKRYGRVPFLPGPPLPPLVTSSAAPELPSPVPPLMSPMTGMPPLVPGMQDPLVYRQLLLQQEYLKQTLFFRQLHMQNLHQVQETESFKALSQEQQQHLAMQMTMQANPVTMQHIHSLQQQQLLSQQQQKLSEQHRTTSPQDSSDPSLSLSNIPLSSDSGNTQLTSTQLTSTPLTSTAAEIEDESAALWGMPVSQAPNTGGWNQPNSMWDVSPGTTEGLSPGYQAQIEKLMKEREETRHKEERVRQQELDRKKEELRRQQEELELQREQMRREKEELERQNMLELQKLEEARRKEEERIHQQEEERLRRQQEEQQRKKQELDKQKKELEDEKRRKEEERRLQEEEKRKLEEMKRQEEEERKRREREQQQQLQKQEEKKRMENNKKKQIEEQKRHMEELRKKEEQRQQQEEMLRLQEQQRKEEERLRNDSVERERLQEEAEYERMREEAARQHNEAQSRQQAEIFRQQESLRRLQQAQQAQLANIKLPAHSNWAANQSNPVQQSRSLMDIQAEEARREQERELEKQSQIQQIQEQSFIAQQTQQQKSWSTLASHTSPRGPSLLDIQKQEQENSRKSNNKKENNPNSYQAKLAASSGSTWSSPLSSQSMWSAPAWDSSVGNAPTIWDQPLGSNRNSAPAPSNKKSSKESGEFPALRNPTQSGGNKNQKKASKPSKNKKEEETVQKLFQQTHKQDSFSDWVAQRVSQFSANVDVPTFVSFIVDVDNPEDIKEYIKTYLGDSRETLDFSRQFIEKRSKFRNQARLEKQQEEDSIWGPAAAVNPYMPTRGGGNLLDNDTSAKSKKSKKKQKMQKLDVSALGFTVHSDPNRKNAAGELESVQ